MLLGNRLLAQPWARCPLWVSTVLLTVLLGAACATEPPPPEQPPAPEVAPAPGEPERQTAEPSIRPRFAVQVGAFENRGKAEALAQELSSRYQQVLVAPVEVRGKTLYRVRLLVETRAEAEALQDSLRHEGKLKTWLIPLT